MPSLNNAHALNPALVAFMIYVWPRATQTDAEGAMARFVQAQAAGGLEFELDNRQRWQAQVTAGAVTGGAATALQAILNAPPLGALNRWGSLQHMRETCIVPCGPSHLAAFDAAVTASQA